MSKHLGPVHYLMYEKIKAQDRLTAYLLAGSPDLETLNRVLPPVSTEDLEGLIDSGNIHGWLSARIDTVEARLAYALARCADTEERLRAFGKRLAPADPPEDAEALFNLVNPILLDGMPCDFALRAEYDDEGSLYLLQTKDVHALYEAHPLDINPADSLGKTCAGGHDHDHHDSFDLYHRDGPPAPIEDKSGAPSRFHRARLALLQGFLSTTDFEPELINACDLRLARRTAKAGSTC